MLPPSLGERVPCVGVADTDMNDECRRLCSWCSRPSRSLHQAVVRAGGVSLTLVVRPRVNTSPPKPAPS
jgi:hypothetical protein